MSLLLTIVSIGIMVAKVVLVATAVASTILKEVVEIAKMVKEIVNILKDLGIIDKNENPEEIGDRCKQAEEAGIDRDKYKTFEEYEKAIKEFPLDREKSKNISDDEKFKYALAYYSMLSEEKLKIKSEDLFKFTASFMKWEKLKGYTREIFDTFRGKDISLGKVADFFQKKLKISEDINVENALVEAIQKKEPEKDRDDILDEFQEMRKAGE
ncbi:hypothetical protein J5690_04845 [bacterium]|nr:hypothetical protein [bacterium]